MTEVTSSSSAALEAWTELNDRQQATLAVIYDLDQDKEQSRRSAGSRGDWDRTPASEWRQIDFAHEPSLKEFVGITRLQSALEARGWHNQGNGATMSALHTRRLITREFRPTTFGRMLTVALTRAGRAAARAGTSPDTGPRPKAELSRRSWEVLALLWTAAVDGGTGKLRWYQSPTIDNRLIGTRTSPLARNTGSGYQITDAGKAFYRQQYDTHTAAHSGVDAPHPDGPAAEPWPAGADDAVEECDRTYTGHRKAWTDATTDHQRAAAELDREPPAVDNLAVSTAVAEMILARHRIWQDTARDRARAAESDVTAIRSICERDAYVYVAIATAVYNAAVAGTDPLEAIGLVDRPGERPQDRPLTRPAKTGIYALDEHAAMLHGAAVGEKRRSRGPKPKRKPAPAGPAVPGESLAALAGFLQSCTVGGELHRRIHANRTGQRSETS